MAPRTKTKSGGRPEGWEITMGNPMGYRDLLGFNDDLMGIQDDLLRFNEDLLRFNEDLMGFHDDLMVI